METPSSGNQPLKLRELSDDVLQLMVSNINDILTERQRESWQRKTQSEEQLRKLFSRFGYETNRANVWRVVWGDHRGCYGLQVGSYVHSCHIDSTSFIVLLLYTKNTIKLMQFDNESLEGPIVL